LLIDLALSIVDYMKYPAISTNSCWGYQRGIQALLAFLLWSVIPWGEYLKNKVSFSELEKRKERIIKTKNKRSQSFSLRIELSIARNNGG